MRANTQLSRLFKHNGSNFEAFPKQLFLFITKIYFLYSILYNLIQFNFTVPFLFLQILGLKEKERLIILLYFPGSETDL